ncbi:MAG UNVERIFIED_CONTAM: hypothetical protein LVT10_14935, partial [Anaerolineae bacterium]
MCQTSLAMFTPWIPLLGFPCLWRSESVITDGIRTTPIVLEDFVIVGSRDKKLYWLDRETGLLSSRMNQNPLQLDGEVLSNMIYLEQDQALDLEQD